MQPKFRSVLRLFVFLSLLVCFVRARRGDDLRSSRRSSKHSSALAEEEEGEDSWGIDAPEPWLSGDPATYLLPPTQSAAAKAAKIRGKKITPQDFLEGHHLYSDAHTSAFAGETLLYVTPWNQKGHSMATLLHNKLTWLAPVWFQIRKDPPTAAAAAAEEESEESEESEEEEGREKPRAKAKAKIRVHGEDGADLAWLRSFSGGSRTCELAAEQGAAGAETGGGGGGGGGASASASTSANACGESHRVQLVPRVSLECKLLTTEEMQEAALELIALQKRLEALDAKIDGFTLEIPFGQLEAALSIPSYLRELQPDMKLIMVLPAIKIMGADTDGGKQHRQVLDLLAQSVDRLSVMTYDRDKTGGPIAPHRWVKEVMVSLGSVPSLAGKLLMGLPAYGWRDGEDMTADKMVAWLAADDTVKVSWDIVAEEHVWSDSRGKIASYPTPYMLQRRLELAAEIGVQGVAVWEAGQAIAAMVDLL